MAIPKRKIATAVKEVQRKSPSQEYISASGGFQQTNDQLVLHWNTHRELNLELIRRAKRDYELKSSLQFKADTVFSEGIKLKNPLQEDDENFEQGETYKAYFEKYVINKPSKPLANTFKQLYIETFYHGLKPAEIVGEFTNIDGREMITLKHVNIKANGSISIITDRYHNVLGIVPKNSFYTNNNTGTTILRKEDFILCTLEQEDNNPLGVPRLLACMDSLCDKWLTLEQRRLFRQTCAVPSVFVIIKNVDTGIPHPSAGRNYTATEYAVEMLKDRTNNSAFAFPTDDTKTTSVEQMEVSSNGEVFEVSIADNNAAIRKVVLLSELTGSQSKDGSRMMADSQTKQVFNRGVMADRLLMEGLINEQLIKPFFIVNFGEENLDLMPLADLGKMLQDGWAEEIDALQSLGLELHYSQFEQLYQQYRLPKPADSWQDKYEMEVEAKAVSLDTQKKNNEQNGKEKAITKQV